MGLKEDYAQEKQQAEARLRSFVVRIVAITLLSIGFMFLLTCISSVSTGTVGVVRHFGAVQAYTLPEGINFTRPWPLANVTEITTQNATTDTEAAAASKDLQSVHTKVTLQWSIDPNMAPRFLQRFGDCDGCWVGILAPAVQEVVKAVSARYTAEQLITHRAEVKLAIELGLNEFIKKTLTDRGVAGAIRIANVAVTNFDFSHEFNASIEAKVKAEQDSLRAENEKKTRITQAEAAGQEQKLSADALAYKTEVESKARAEAIQRESKALESNPSLIQLRIAERWDGKLPQYTGTTIPMLQVK